MSDSSINGDRLREQIAYYRARAHEYDDWFFRKGRYDRGPELRRKWVQELDQVRTALTKFAPAGQVLEIACGTGLWTEQIHPHADRITAVDAASEMLALNRERLNSSKVTYVHLDIFQWKPRMQFDVIFFGFWLSHVPPQQFARFWQLVDDSLKPGGRVFLVDSLYDPTSTAKDHTLNGRHGTSVKRRLNDGPEFEIVKVFYDPDQMQKLLDELGWAFRMKQTVNYFLYGSGQRKQT